MKCIGNLVVTSVEPKKIDKFLKVKISDEKALVKILMLYRKIYINTEDKKIIEYIKNLLNLTAVMQETLVKAFIEKSDASLVENNKTYTKEELKKIFEDKHIEYHMKENKHKYKRRKNDDILVIRKNGDKFEIYYYFRFPIIKD